MSKAETPPKETMLELYKLYVEMTDRISQRRQSANNYFLTINTALITLVIASLIYSRFIKDMSPVFTVSVLVGVFLLLILINCRVWCPLIKSYKAMNGAKFKVIHDMEEIIGYRPYFDEWEHLGRGEDKKIYNKFTNVESGLPTALSIGYAIAIVVAIVLSFCGVF